MENRESNYYRKDSASRPPQREDASQRESTLFTELPLDSVRRTPSSGRPAPEYTGTANENRRAARPAADTGRAAPRAVPYTPQSRPAQSYANYNGYSDSRQGQPRRQEPYYGGRSTAFTEISWDALRSGNLEQGAPNARRAVPAQPQAEPYRNTAQPRQADPYYYGNAAPAQQTAPYRRSDGTYRQTASNDTYIIFHIVSSFTPIIPIELVCFIINIITPIISSVNK